MPAAITPAIGNGRGLTNYMTRCEVETGLQAKFKIHSDAEYRTKLQGNPRSFDDAVKGFTKFEPFWPVNPCADANTMKMM